MNSDNISFHKIQALSLCKELHKLLFTINWHYTQYSHTLIYTDFVTKHYRIDKSHSIRSHSPCRAAQCICQQRPTNKPINPHDTLILRRTTKRVMFAPRRPPPSFARKISLLDRERERMQCNIISLPLHSILYHTISAIHSPIRRVHSHPLCCR